MVWCAIISVWEEPINPLPHLENQMTSRSALYAARLEEMAARHRQTDLDVKESRQQLQAALDRFQDTATQLTSD